MDTVPDKSLLVEVARLYYDHRMNQQQIAEKISTSRPTVSRILQQARDEGIIRVEIVDPTLRGSKLEQLLKEKYRLKKVIIVPSNGESVQETKKRLGQAAARYLNELVFDNCVMGVSWGTTMHQIVHHLTPRTVKNMRVIQVVGGITHAEFDPHASEIAQRFGENYNARSNFLLLPAVVDSVSVKQAMISDTRIKEALDLMKKADIVVCSVGTFRPDSLLIQAEYFSPKDVAHLKEAGAVGDICSRMINKAGEIVWPELDARTVAIELNDLKKASYVIAVAGGEEKKEVIFAGLQGGYFSVLITDEEVGDYLLEL